MALALTTLTGFPSGFTLTISMFPRAPRSDGSWPRIGNGFDPDGDGGAGEFRCEIIFPDGRKAQPLGDATPDEEPPGSPVCSAYFGGIIGPFQHRAYYIWPLPTRGAVTVLTEWRAEGIAPANHAIASELIRSAASRAERIWPDASVAID